MVDERKEARLNEAVLQWKSLPREGNGAALAALRNEIWILAFELFDPRTENFRSKGANTDRELERATMIFLDVFEEVMEKYLPEKGHFSNFLCFLLKRRLVSAYETDKIHSPEGDSIDDITEADDGSIIGGPTPAAPEDQEPEVRVMLNDLFAELTAMILNFSERHSGQSNNESRKMWYRLFYTEDMTLAAQTVELSTSHERDIFAAMKLPYLDYYMGKKCRTLRQLAHTSLKPYGEVVPARKGQREETPLPLPADVSLSYLKICENISAGSSARSNQMKPYRAEIREMRQC